MSWPLRLMPSFLLLKTLYPVVRSWMLLTLLLRCWVDDMLYSAEVSYSA